MFIVAEETEKRKLCEDDLTCHGWLPKLDECPPTILLLLV